MKCDYHYFTVICQFSYFIDNLELCYIYNGNLFLKYGFFVLIFMLFIFLITSTVLFYQKNVNGSIRKRNAFNNLITLFDPNYINAKETIKSEVDDDQFVSEKLTLN